MRMLSLKSVVRATRRYLANAAIFGSLLTVIIYLDSGLQNKPGSLQDDLRASPELGLSRKWHRLDTKRPDPEDAEQTTAAFLDHTPGESDGLGVFHFFQNLWSSKDKKSRLESGLERRHLPDSQSDKRLMAFSLRVTDEQINTFNVNLPPLLPDYKNPCWVEELPPDFSYDKSFYSQCVISRRRQISKHAHKFHGFEAYLQNRTRWRVRCFPYFFVLGVGKCGTTDFFDTMKNFVNDIVPGFLKELHFWEWKRCHERELCRSVDGGRPTFADYLDTYDAAAEVIRRTVIKRPGGSLYHPLVIGDFTPSTLTFYPCWQRLPGNEHLAEPRYTTAHYIYSIRPQTKFIILLRDPVERVYSNYRMQKRLSGKTSENPETFHKDVSKVIRDIEKCFREKTHRACVYKDMKFDIWTHVTNSLYEIFIRDWLLLFPRDQFLFIKMEDYSSNRLPLVKEVIKFLGLSRLSAEQEIEIENKPVTNSSSKKGDMKNETRTLLRNFFKPWNQRLAKLLKDDKFTWNY